MDDFKVGDRVHLVGDGEWPGWPGVSRFGVVVEVTPEWVFVDHDAPSAADRQQHCGWRRWSLEMVESAPDPVNHPAHYTQYPVEVIEITKHLDFPRGNVVKYVTRSPHKGSEVEDLKKARWYLDLAIEMAEKSNE